MGEFEDARRQQATERSRQWSRDDVQGQTKGEFVSSVPSGEVIGNAGHHSGLKHTQQESDARGTVDVVHECSADGADAETERDGRDEVSGSNELAGHIGGDFEDDVGDVENRQDDVVTVAH